MEGSLPEEKDASSGEENGEDDEKYWAMMEDAAAQIGDMDEVESPSVPPAKLPFQSEEEYYESHVEGAGCDERWSSEEDVVWQSLLRSVVGTHVRGIQASNNVCGLLKIDHVRSKSALHLLQQYLFGYLPQSSVVFQKVRNLIPEGGGAKDHFDVWTDSPSHPSVVFIVEDNRWEKDIDVSLFSSIQLSLPLAESVGKVVRQRAIDSGKSDICFSSLDCSFHENLKSGLQASGVAFDWEAPCGLYVLSAGPGSHQQTSLTLPTGYFLAPLRDDDAVIVNSTWAYKTDHSEAMVRRMIATRPSMGVRHSLKHAAHDDEHTETAEKGLEADELVSWVLTYEYGALGMMFTLPEHRGKGLARCAVTALLPYWQAHDYGHAPFCFINVGNESSRTVFQFLGFEKAADQAWLGFVVPTRAPAEP